MLAGLLPPGKHARGQWALDLLSIAGIAEGGSVRIKMITMMIAMIIFIVIIKVLVGLRRAKKGGAGEELDLNIGC